MSVCEETKWIEHKYLFTYRIASKVQAVADNPLSHIRDLEALTLDFGIVGFIPHWQKDSALHKFIRYVADDIMERDNIGDWKISFGADPIHPKWTIPVEAALTIYGLQKEVSFEIPRIPQVHEKRGNITHVTDAPGVADACYDHFQGLRWSQLYEDLLHRIADEVFFVMFTNRVTLQNLHEFLARYTFEFAEYADSTHEHSDMGKFFTKSGRIRRTSIPKWARRAIFFRDRGLCTKCNKNVSGLIDPLSVENYDHIVPLAAGGLNDVSNLQLLCESCNKGKSDRYEPVSNRYRRWY
ncbi:HNH endonuclease [Streptomyces sp. 3N207]|uniref:HNH endonuclease n=1 Tax=Streptomyces sp. 3N207 TaxID=3457417 RepID=UPI003FD4DA4C